LQRFDSDLLNKYIIFIL